MLYIEKSKINMPPKVKITENDIVEASIQLIRERGIEGEDNLEIIELISQMTGLKEKGSKQLYINIWLVVHGIASMLATNSCNFSNNEIETIVKDSFAGFSRELKLKESGDEK